MEPIQIVQLLRIAISAGNSIGISWQRLRDMADEDGNITDEQVDQLLAEWDSELDQL